ncbi:hypothetical protein [Pacificoceanicola onchidii]|uniref:hypothetical protein n=1 Tax=Pacificoceanicola onchidii TaxID=2562685 RepID=UPI0010A30754|nr:hypothetical protein [Pacificoceanicola onchidii]
MMRSIDDLKISEAHKSQLRRARVREQNDLGLKWIARGLKSNAAAFPHLFRREGGSFLDFDLDEMIQEHRIGEMELDWPAFFSDAVLFTNPLAKGEYDPNKRVPGKHSGGTPPSQRIVNGGWLVLTFEVDSTTIGELEMQLDWFAGKPDICAFSKVHAALSKYADYRGYSVIFSGNKSLHIHIVFDIRHLSKGLLPHQRRYRALWKKDVSGAALAELHRLVWLEAAGIIQAQLNTQAKFDPKLSSYIQKRRSPWGVRTLIKPSKLQGFSVGDQVGQVVLQERLANRTLAPLGAPALFDADKIKGFSAVARTLTRMPSANRVQSVNAKQVLAELQSYLKNYGWCDYPKPVDLRFDGEHNIVFFKNDASDVHPSTIVRGDYRRLLAAGRGASPKPAFLPNNLTLDQTLELLPSVAATTPTNTRSVTRLPKMGQPLFGAIDTSSARGKAASVFHHAATQPGPTLIQGPEGLGKTYSLMESFYDLWMDDDVHLFGVAAPAMSLSNPSRGFTGFSARSEAQLSEKLSEFHSLHPTNHAISLPSFSSLYAQALNATGTSKQYSRADAGSAGELSLLHFIKKQQPEVFSEMERLRDDLWRTENGATIFQPNAVVFLVHGLLKVWPHAIFTRAFLHPDCPSDLDPQKLQACADQMSFRRVIYDEVSVDDLVSVLPAWQVKLSDKARKKCKSISGKRWDEVPLQTRVAAFETIIAANAEPDTKFDFDTCDQIIRQRIRLKKDKITVDASLFPFGNGTDEKNVYVTQVDGCEYYCKPQRWFSSMGCPVVVLTTEDLPRLVVSGMNQKRGPNEEKVFRVINMTHTPHLHRDSVPLVFDSRARNPRGEKESVIDLAESLLAAGFEFVISNKLNPGDKRWQGKVAAHEGARGRNDLVGKKIASILLYPAPSQFAELCALGMAFNIPNPHVVAYRDQIHQSLGRNLGFRYTSGQRDDAHVVVMKSGLYRDLDGLGGQSVPQGGTPRYQFVLSDENFN